MKFAALILISLLALQLWGGEVSFYVVSLKHLSDDDYIFQVDIISTISDPGNKPLTVKEVENCLPRDDRHLTSSFAKARKDHPNWFIDSQKYLVKKGFTSTYSYRNDKSQRDFTGEVTSSGGKGEFTSVKFKFSRIFPLPGNDDGEPIAYRHRALETTANMRDGETQVMGGIGIPESDLPGSSLFEIKEHFEAK